MRDEGDMHYSHQFLPRFVNDIDSDGFRAEEGGSVAERVGYHCKHTPLLRKIHTQTARQKP